MPDFFAFAFREKTPILRVMSVIVILVAMLLYVAAQFAAAGNAFAVSFDDVDYKVGVIIGTVIVLLYTVIGGFRAACWTDFAQGLIMVGTLVIFPIGLLFHLGGYGYIEQHTTHLADGGYLSLSPQATGVALMGFLLGSGALGINFGYPGQPHVLVRFMALRDAKDAKIAGVISATWGTCVLFGAVTIGLLVRAVTEQHIGAGALDAWTRPLQDEVTSNAGNMGETGLVLAARNLIPGIFAGMVLAAVLAAICSTADSQLVVAASSAANDLYARLVDKSGKLAHLVVNRTVMFSLGLGAALLVIDQDVKVYTFVTDYGWAIMGAAFGPQIILILLWRRATYAGCVAGMSTGFAVALLWKRLADNTLTIGETDVQVYNLTLGFVAALVVNVVVSLLTPKA